MKEEILRTINLCSARKKSGNLQDVSFTLHKTEVVSLLGLQGSGNSQVSKILCGTLPGYKGKIFVDEQEVELANESISRKSGIFRISRQKALIDDLSIGENIFVLRRNSLKHFFLNKRRINLFTKKLLLEIGLDLNPSTKLARLNVPERHLVELVKAQAGGAKIILFEDSFGEYHPEDLQKLSGVIGKLRKKGLAFLILSHNMDDHEILSEKFILFKEGRIIKKTGTGIPDVSRLTEMIMGKDSKASKEIYRGEGDVVFTLNDGKGINISARKGEILGICWEDIIQKNEFIRIIRGNNSRSDEIFMSLNREPLKSPNLYRLYRKKIIFIPRVSDPDSYISNLSRDENLLLPSITKICGPAGYVADSVPRMLGAQFADSFINLESKGESEPSHEYKISVIMERWLVFNPRVVILQDPFVMADMKMSALIDRFIFRLSSLGTAIIILSSKPNKIKEISHTLKWIGRY